MLDQLIAKYGIFMDKVVSRHCPICDFDLIEKDEGLCCMQHGNMFSMSFMDIEGKKYNERLLAVVKAVIEGVNPIDVDHKKSLEDIPKIKENSDNKKNKESLEHHLSMLIRKKEIAEKKLLSTEYPEVVKENFKGIIATLDADIKVLEAKIVKTQET